MAAPTATVRQTPSGLRLVNGFSSKVTLKRYPAISLWEISGTNFGYSGGEPVDTTTMHNVAVRTKHPRDLYERTDATWTFAYDPAVGNQLREAVNQLDEVTVTWRDGSTEANWAWLREATFNELTDGEMPTMSCVFTPGNMDPTLVEREGVIASVAGT